MFGINGSCVCFPEIFNGTALSALAYERCPHRPARGSLPSVQNFSPRASGGRGLSGLIYVG
jgi:hypothetical protein